MIRYLLGSTALLGAVMFNANVNAATPNPTPALATPVLKINGNSSFNSWFFKENRKTVIGDADNSPEDRQRMSRVPLFTVDNARLRFVVEGKTDPGMDYGFVLVLDGNTDATKNIRENYLFVGGTWGKVNAGDTYGVQDTMAFGGFSEWGGTGFINGGVFDRVVNYTTGTLHSVDLVGDASRDTKLTYYTPRWKGIQGGLSYTPRQQHRGQQAANSISSTTNPKEPFDTDNIASGVNFIHKFANGFEMALSGTSIFAAKTHPEYLGAYKRKQTASFAFGGTLNYADIGFGAEYGNNGKSHEIQDQHKANAGEFIDFGLSYTWGATKFSTGYYYGWRNSLGGGLTPDTFTRKKAKTQAVSGAIDHKLAPGFGVYLEYAHYHMKNGAAIAEANRINAQLKPAGQFVSPVKNNNANVFVLGSRIVF